MILGRTWQYSMILCKIWQGLDNPSWDLVGLDKDLTILDDTS